MHQPHRGFHGLFGDAIHPRAELHAADLHVCPAHSSYPTPSAPHTHIPLPHSIFNIPKDGQSIVGFAPRAASTKSRDIGAIVGGTVGGVAGVVALGLLAFFLIRRRQDNTFFARAAELEEEHKVASTVEPYTLGAEPHTPSFPGYLPGSPPAGAHHPLLDAAGVHDAHSGAAPPTYEEASESGLASPRGYPRDSKMTYRRDTMMSTSVGSPPGSPSRTGFSGSSNV